MNTDIAKILEEHGHKVTSQRVALAQIMFARPQHLSADALLELARAAGVRVSKATVYNTLNLFAECGVVREVNVDGSRVYYDSTTHPHHHLFNMDTGELTDLPEDSVRLAELPPLPEDTEAVGVDVIVKVRSRRD
jgi:Fur family iron response transcriptional regulator